MYEALLSRRALLHSGFGILAYEQRRITWIRPEAYWRPSATPAYAGICYDAEFQDHTPKSDLKRSSSREGHMPYEIHHWEEIAGDFERAPLSSATVQVSQSILASVTGLY